MRAEGARVAPWVREIKPIHACEKFWLGYDVTSVRPSVRNPAMLMRPCLSSIYVINVFESIYVTNSGRKNKTDTSRILKRNHSTPSFWLYPIHCCEYVCDSIPTRTGWSPQTISNVIFKNTPTKSKCNGEWANKRETNT